MNPRKRLPCLRANREEVSQVKIFVEAVCLATERVRYNLCSQTSRGIPSITLPTVTNDVSNL